MERQNYIMHSSGILDHNNKTVHPVINAVNGFSTTLVVLKDSKINVADICFIDV